MSQNVTSAVTDQKRIGNEWDEAYWPSDWLVLGMDLSPLPYINGITMLSRILR